MIRRFNFRPLSPATSAFNRGAVPRTGAGASSQCKQISPLDGAATLREGIAFDIAALSQE